jgi:hypothetical protein
METMGQYFARPDTPSAGSPVGERMQDIMRKNPKMSFADARVAAGGLTPEQVEALPIVTGWTSEQEAEIQRIMKQTGAPRQYAIRWMRTGHIGEYRLSGGLAPARPKRILTETQRHALTERLKVARQARSAGLQEKRAAIRA